jgi:hypothetical protein
LQTRVNAVVAAADEVQWHPAGQYQRGAGL